MPAATREGTTARPLTGKAPLSIRPIYLRRSPGSPERGGIGRRDTDARGERKVGEHRIAQPPGDALGTIVQPGDPKKLPSADHSHRPRTGRPRRAVDVANAVQAPIETRRGRTASWRLRRARCGRRRWPRFASWNRRRPTGHRPRRRSRLLAEGVFVPLLPTRRITSAAGSNWMEKLVPDTGPRPVSPKPPAGLDQRGRPIRLVEGVNPPAGAVHSERI